MTLYKSLNFFFPQFSLLKNKTDNTEKYFRRLEGIKEILSLMHRAGHTCPLSMWAPVILSITLPNDIIDHGVSLLPKGNLIKFMYLGKVFILPKENWAVFGCSI